MGLQGLQDGRVPGGGLFSRLRRDAFPVGLDEWDDFAVFAEEEAGIAVFYGLPLEIGDRGDAHLVEGGRGPAVDFESGWRAKFTGENVVHREREELSHLVADA